MLGVVLAFFEVGGLVRELMMAFMEEWARAQFRVATGLAARDCSDPGTEVGFAAPRLLRQPSLLASMSSSTADPVEAQEEDG